MKDEDIKLPEMSAGIFEREFWPVIESSPNRLSGKGECRLERIVQEMMWGYAREAVRLNIDPLMRQRSDAWYAMVEALNEARPQWWAENGKTAIEAAVDTIKELADQKEKPAEGPSKIAVISQGPEEFRADIATVVKVLDCQYLSEEARQCAEKWLMGLIEGKPVMDGIPVKNQCDMKMKISIDPADIQKSEKLVERAGK